MERGRRLFNRVKSSGRAERFRSRDQRPAQFVEQRSRELEEGVSTEQDVRARFGEPEQVWQEADGSRTLEYNRQPAGRRNYMITIGTDGKMSALRQVLAPHHFAKVQPGMTQEQVRRLLR